MYCGLKDRFVGGHRKHFIDTFQENLNCLKETWCDAPAAVVLQLLRYSGTWRHCALHVIRTGYTLCSSYQWLNPTSLSLLAVVLFTCIHFVSCRVTMWWTEVVQIYVRWYQWLHSGFSFSDYCFPLTRGNKKSGGCRALFEGFRASSAAWLRSSLFFGC